MYQNSLSLSSSETLIVKRVLRHESRRKLVLFWAEEKVSHKRTFLLQPSLYSPNCHQGVSPKLLGIRGSRKLVTIVHVSSRLLNEYHPKRLSETSLTTSTLITRSHLINGKGRS